MSLSLRRTGIVVPVLLACLGCGKGGQPFFMPPPPVAKKMAVVQSPPPVVVTTIDQPAADPANDLAPKDDLSPLVESPVGEPAIGEPPTVQPVPQPVEPGTILHADSFADVAGSIHLNKNGMKTTEGSPNLRTVYFFAAMPEGGAFTMQVFEDATTKGPDGEPGVLSLSWLEV